MQSSPGVPSLDAPRRPHYEWLAELERLRDAAAAGNRAKVTIMDVADLSVEPGATAAACMPSSPRSVEACLRMGIDPACLLHRPLDHFLRAERSPELTQLAYEHEEGIRQGRLKALVEERRRLEEAARAGSSKVGGCCSTAHGSMMSSAAAASCLAPCRHTLSLQCMPPAILSPPSKASLMPSCGTPPCISTSLRAAQPTAYAPGPAQNASSKPGGGSAAAAGAEDLVEKEQRRLEVMRRRQERELAQLISYEVARKQMQEKAEAKAGFCLVLLPSPVSRGRGVQRLVRAGGSRGAGQRAGEKRAAYQRNRTSRGQWLGTKRKKSLLSIQACCWLAQRNGYPWPPPHPPPHPHTIPPMQVQEQERRAEEQRRAKQAADEEWRRAQHERELQRKQEEEAREKEIKARGAGGWPDSTEGLSLC
jgi:hypothetical protein